jgi:hypothetical protein
MRALKRGARRKATRRRPCGNSKDGKGRQCSTASGGSGNLARHRVGEDPRSSRPPKPPGRKGRGDDRPSEPWRRLAEAEGGGACTVRRTRVQEVQGQPKKRDRLSDNSRRQALRSTTGDHLQDLMGRPERAIRTITAPGRAAKARGRHHERAGGKGTPHPARPPGTRPTAAGRSAGAADGGLKRNSTPSLPCSASALLASEKFSPACRWVFATKRRRASGRLWRPISVERVSHKNASAKQS